MDKAHIFFAWPYVFNTEIYFLTLKKLLVNIVAFILKYMNV